MPISIPFPEIACNGSRYVLLQGSKGAAVGLAVGLTGIWAASRRFPGFRGMPLSFKAFLCSAVTAGTSVTVADRASLAFERKRYGGPEQERVVLPTNADWKHKVPVNEELLLIPDCAVG